MTKAWEIFIKASESAVRQNDGALGLIINRYNKPALAQMVHYFAGVNCEWLEDVGGKNLNVPQNTGILAVGPVGCFKTGSARLIQKLLPKDKGFAFASCKKLADGYKDSKTGGISSLTKYVRGLQYLFDDLGLEDRAAKHFNDPFNCMEKVILDRYELWHDYGIRSHFTTNVEPTLENFTRLYGERAATRLLHMTTIVAFHSKAGGMRPKSTPIPINSKPQAIIPQNTKKLTEAEKIQILQDAKRKAALMATKGKHQVKEPGDRHAKDRRSMVMEQLPHIKFMSVRQCGSLIQSLLKYDNAEYEPLIEACNKRIEKLQKAVSK